MNPKDHEYMMCMLAEAGEAAFWAWVGKLGLYSAPVTIQDREMFVVRWVPQMLNAIRAFVENHGEDWSKVITMADDHYERKLRRRG